MAALLTYEDALAAYLANCSYLTNESAAEAAAFVEACRALLVLTPKRAAHGGRGAEEIETSPETLAEQLKDAQRYLGSIRLNASGRVRFRSLEDMRD
jgi:hypothetical protein